MNLFCFNSNKQNTTTKHNMETVNNSNVFTPVKSSPLKSRKKKMHLSEFHALYPSTPVKVASDETPDKEQNKNPEQNKTRDDVEKRRDVHVDNTVNKSKQKSPVKPNKNKKPRPTKDNGKKKWETTEKKKPERANMRKPDPKDPSETVTLDHEEIPPNKTVILKHLPKEGVTERDLNFFFKKAGSVKNVKVIRNKDGTCKGIAFVEYYELDHAKKALKFNRFWYEDQKVYVSYAAPRK